MVTIRKCANGYIIDTISPDMRHTPRGELELYVAVDASSCWKIAYELLEGKQVTRDHEAKG